MRRLICVSLALGLFAGVATKVAAQETQRDTAFYVDKYEDPAIEELDGANEALIEAAKAKTEEILATYRDAEKARTEPKQKLRFDLEGLVKPSGPEAFSTRVWHFPPTPQFLTGACWSFSSTSFMESEIKRINGSEIKLSEMWTVYWEFVNKARGVIASRGESVYNHGSQTAALMVVFKEYGVVPRADYEGVITEDPRFNHDIMVDQIRAFLAWCEEQNFWHEDIVIAMVRRILDETMGRPPETIVWDGAEMTPTDFLAKVCQVDPGDYVSLMSTLSVPFYSRGEYAVPDNWWHDTGYVNVPLDVWYDTILKVIGSGGSMVIGGDVSEPGINGFEDVAVVPSFDIPAEFIDQSAREFRFSNGTSTDDHGIHLVGHTALDGHDWFLIKDSNRSSRHGEFEGYYFYRDDFVRLKMLTYTVHEDQISEILARVDSP